MFDDDEESGRAICFATKTEAEAGRFTGLFGCGIRFSDIGVLRQKMENDIINGWVRV